MNPGRARTLRVARPVDIALTLAPLRHGPRDPSMRIAPGALWRAARTPGGPVTTYVANEADRVVVRAWGPGTEWTLDHAEDLVGAHDDDRPLVTRHPVLAALARRFAGLRIPRTGLVLDTMLPVIVEQKVTAAEAHDSWAHLVNAWGEPAPGPPGLRLAPAPERLAAAPYFALHRFGLERRRASFVIAACRRAAGLEATVALAPADADVRLRAQPGVGPWTAGHVRLLAFGDPDAVIIGDYHLPHLVCAALAGERRGSDERMLELLEPYRGQRGRVMRLIASGTPHTPRRAPRRAHRAIAAI